LRPGLWLGLGGWLIFAFLLAGSRRKAGLRTDRRVGEVQKQ